MTTDAMRSEFDARLMRISAGTGHTKGTIFVGLDESYRYVPRPQSRHRRAGGVLGNFGYPFSMLLALSLGLTAALLGLGARYHLGGGFGKDLPVSYDFFLNITVGFVLGYILTQLLRLRSAEHVVLQFVGVVTMLCTYHNLVHLHPETFAAVFAPDWVRVVLNHSDASSIMIAGVVIPI